MEKQYGKFKKVNLFSKSVFLNSVSDHANVGSGAIWLKTIKFCAICPFIKEFSALYNGYLTFIIAQERRAGSSDCIQFWFSEGGGRGWGSRFSSNLPSSLTPSAEFACANSGMQACNPSQQRGGRGEGGGIRKITESVIVLEWALKGQCQKKSMGFLSWKVLL